MPRLAFPGAPPKIPAWVKPVASDLNIHVENNRVSDGYFFALVDEQYHTVFKESFYHYATKVVSEAGLTGASQIEITYDPSYQRADIHYIHVRRNGILSDRSTTSDIRVLDEEKKRSEGILSGEKTLYVNLPDIRKGDLVEYAYTITGENKIFGDHFAQHFRFSYGVPVGRLHRRMLFRKSVMPSMKNTGCSITPAVVEEAGHREYIWEVTNPAIVKQEDDCPAWFDPFASVEVSSFSNWKEVKGWFRALFETGKYDSRQLEILADSIKRQYPGSEKRMITAAVDFVQNEIRYSGNEQGIYSHTPHLPDYVLKNQYGDCKDKTVLLVELLRRLGVKAYPALVHTAYRDRISSQIYSFYKFNHCIAAIKYDGYAVFIDPTATYQAGSFLQRNGGNYGLAMVLDSSDALFTTMPAPVNKTWVKEEFNILDNGHAELTATFRYQGIGADDTRAYFATNALEAIQESYRNVYTEYVENVEVASPVTITDHPDKNEFITVERYLLKDFWKQKDGEMKISREYLPYFLNRRITYAKSGTRNQPQALSHPVWVNHMIRITKTGGWSIPESRFTENSPFFYYEYKVRAAQDLLELSYQYTSRKDAVMPGQFALYKAASDRVAQNMVMSTQLSLAESAQAAGFNWLLLAVLLASATGSVLICIHLNKRNFNYGTEQRYDGIGGWLALMAIGIIVSPLVLGYELISHYSDMMGISYFRLYFDRASALYEPFRGYFLLAMAVLNTFLLVSSGFLIHQFFKCRNTFRVYYTGFKIFNVLLLVLDITVTYLFFHNENDSEERLQLASEKGSIMRIILQSAIWIPYLWISERCKYTFTVAPEESADTSAGELAVPAPASSASAENK